MTRLGFTVAAILSALAVCAAPAGAQTPFDPPRLPDGRPDLQGVWDFRTLTPLERPADLADQAVYREEEAAAIEAEAAAQSAASLAPTTERSVLPVGGDVGAYNSYWMDQGARLVEDQRTSLIVDPPDGRVPPLQPGAVNQVLSLSEDVGGSLPVRVRSAGISADSHEARGLAERCILGFNTGPPILPGFYNQNVQLFQTGDHLVILHEMIHDARIVPLDGRAHVAEGIRQWMGDSRGYWDGDTLVVETTNFTDKVASFNPTVATAARHRRHPAPDGALQPRGRGHPSVRVHRERPDDLHAAVQRGPADEAGRHAVRVRVPRRKLRAVQPVGRRAAGGAEERRRVIRRGGRRPGRPTRGIAGVRAADGADARPPTARRPPPRGRRPGCPPCRSCPRGRRTRTPRPRTSSGSPARSRATATSSGPSP